MGQSGTRAPGGGHGSGSPSAQALGDQEAEVAQSLAATHVPSFLLPESPQLGLSQN